MGSIDRAARSLAVLLLAGCIHLPRRAVVRDALTPDEYVTLGDIAYHEGRLPESESAYRKALKAAPHHERASNNLAAVLVDRRGDLKEAETLALDALAQNGPLKPFILDTLADIHRLQAGAKGRTP